MLVDTHCHLHDQEWFTPEQSAQFLHDAQADGVQKIICIGTDQDDSLAAKAFAAEHSGVYWTYGFHPEHASKQSLGKSSTNEHLAALGKSSTNEHLATLSESSTNEHLATLDKLPTDERLVAIGEIGLDYHYDTSFRQAQIRLFEEMLQLAQDQNLPVSLHIREAFADAWPVLDNFSTIKGVVHSFTGNKRELKNALERGFYIGINGLVTYTTPPLPPLERIVLETDAPFLTPVPFRGKINSPRYVKQIAEYLGTKLGVDLSIVEEKTTQNARNIFRIC